VWSTNIIEKLNKRAKKSRSHGVDPYGSDRGEGMGDYEVIHHGETLPNGDFKNFKYIIHIVEDMMSKIYMFKIKPNWYSIFSIYMSLL
jgi:hypothetical protein